MEREFQEKVAVITGGGRGFGKAFGQALAERGAHAVLLDLDGVVADQAAKEIRTTGLTASAVACDVANDAQAEEVMHCIASEHGGIDILINNAGLHSQDYNEPMSASGMAKLRRLFDVNLMGMIGCSLAARPGMAGRPNATIVNISSSAAYGCHTAYGVSKLAVRGVTVTLAREFASQGIRVNAIAPGMIGTETIKAELPKQVVDFVHSQQILPRWGEVADIVEAMLYLCSARSSFITGETLRVTGGFQQHV